MEDGTTANGYTMTLGTGGRAIHHHLETLAPLLIGRCPLEIRVLWEDLFWSAIHWVGRAGTAAMAHSAIDIALWDARAKVTGVPLWRLLGGSGDKRLGAYNTHAGWLNIETNQLLANAETAVEEGMIGIKLKLGLPDWKEDLQRIAKVRNAVGSKFLVMTDVNQRWDLNTAITVGQRLFEFDVYWLEEPLDPDDVLAHSKLVRTISTPVALGEHLYAVRAFRDFAHYDAARILQPDVTRVGGISAFLQVAELAAAYNIPVCAHAGDLMQVHQHLSLALPNVQMLEYLPWCTSIWEEPARVERGFLQAPEAPGASTSIKREVFETYREI